MGEARKVKEMQDEEDKEGKGKARCGRQAETKQTENTPLGDCEFSLKLLVT